VKIAFASGAREVSEGRDRNTRTDVEVVHRQIFESVARVDEVGRGNVVAEQRVAPRVSGGSFMTTKPARARCSTICSAAIRTMYSSAAGRADDRDSVRRKRPIWRGRARLSASNAPNDADARDKPGQTRS
jgi:hypothetical protein